MPEAKPTVIKIEVDDEAIRTAAAALGGLVNLALEAVASLLPGLAGTTHIDYTIAAPADDPESTTERVERLGGPQPDSSASMAYASWYLNMPADILSPNAWPHSFFDLKPEFQQAWRSVVLSVRETDKP